MLLSSIVSDLLPRTILFWWMVRTKPNFAPARPFVPSWQRRENDAHSVAAHTRRPGSECLESRVPPTQNHSFPAGNSGRENACNRGHSRGHGGARIRTQSAGSPALEGGTSALARQGAGLPL